MFTLFYNSSLIFLPQYSCFEIYHMYVILKHYYIYKINILSWEKYGVEITCNQ